MVNRERRCRPSLRTTQTTRVSEKEGTAEISDRNATTAGQGQGPLHQVKAVTTVNHDRRGSPRKRTTRTTRVSEKEGTGQLMDRTATTADQCRAGTAVNRVRRCRQTILRTTRTTKVSEKADTGKLPSEISRICTI